MLQIVVPPIYNISNHEHVSFGRGEEKKHSPSTGMRHLEYNQGFEMIIDGFETWLLLPGRYVTLGTSRSETARRFPVFCFVSLF
jgi:hypothetical protein